MTEETHVNTCSGLNGAAPVSPAEHCGTAARGLQWTRTCRRNRARGIVACLSSASLSAPNPQRRMTFIGEVMRESVHGFMRGQEGVFSRHGCDFRRLPRSSGAEVHLDAQRPLNGFFLAAMGWRCVWAEANPVCRWSDRAPTGPRPTRREILANVRVRSTVAAGPPTDHWCKLARQSP